MFALGEQVVYGIHGVCRITDTEERLVDRKKVQYLVLEPADSPGTRFLVPSQNPAAMAKLRPVLTRQELENLLASGEIRKDVWLTDENARKQRYRELITAADRTALLQMVFSLHAHKAAAQAAGRKFHLCDENFLRDAQRLLSAEFSLVLGIAPDAVGEYVLKAAEQ